MARDAEGLAGELEDEGLFAAVDAEEDFLIGGSDGVGGDRVGDLLAEGLEVVEVLSGVVVDDVTGAEAGGAGGRIGADFGDEETGGGGVFHFGEDGLVVVFDGVRAEARGGGGEEADEQQGMTMDE